MSDKSLGDRMKEYEAVTTSGTLTRRVPVIIRLDGRAFHTFSRRMERPYDEVFHQCMCWTSLELCKKVQGSKFAFHFSDEISILLTDYDTLDTEPYFGYCLQKVVSVTASLCTARFADACLQRGVPWARPVQQFDCRAFNVPRDDIANYFLFRQRDCTRNSIQSCAQTVYSHKQLHGADSSKMQDMLMEKGINWNKMPTRFKRGIAVYKPMVDWFADYETPIFSKYREFVEMWTLPEEEREKLEDRERPGWGEEYKDARALGFVDDKPEGGHAQNQERR